MLGDFIQCPFCSGHEAVSLEAADMIAHWIEDWLACEHANPANEELHNMLNVIRNTQERATTIDPLLT